MTRNTHDRQFDHHSVDLASNIVLETSTSSYPAETTLQALLDDMDTKVSTMSGAIENGFDFRQLGAAPSGATEGYSYYDTTIHKVRTWDGSGWQNHW